jgi:hypothetical protein
MKRDPAQKLKSYGGLPWKWRSSSTEQKALLARLHDLVEKTTELSFSCGSFGEPRIPPCTDDHFFGSSIRPDNSYSNIVLAYIPTATSIHLDVVRPYNISIWFQFDDTPTARPHVVRDALNLAHLTFFATQRQNASVEYLWRTLWTYCLYRYWNLKPRYPFTVKSLNTAERQPTNRSISSEPWWTFNTYYYWLFLFSSWDQEQQLLKEATHNVICTWRTLQSQMLGSEFFPHYSWRRAMS